MNNKFFTKPLCTILAGCALGAISLLSFSSAAQAQAQYLATCENGIFRGRVIDGILNYRGIPFAKPPVGELRWQLPQAPEKSKAIYDAYEFGKVSLQSPNFITGSDMSDAMSEDCLTLNIYVNPKDTTKKKAVMVWIHGGAFVGGSGSDPFYDGTNFLTNNPDIILVTTNYRLGITGFVNFANIPGGDKYPHLNLGLYDQIAALKWVKNNIAAFGGDPECVTIFGESAGAGSVSALAIAPAAKDLFRRVIIQSGSVSLIMPKEANTTLPADLLARSFQAKNMQDLVNLPGDTLHNYWKENSEKSYNFAIQDDTLLPKDPFACWAKGDTKKLDILQGCMMDEWRLFALSFRPESYFHRINQTVPAYLSKTATPAYNKAYAKYTQYIQKKYPQKWWDTELINDYYFFAGMQYQATEHAKNGGRGYTYLMTQSVDNPKEIQAAHGTDLYFVFGNFNDKSILDTPANRKLSRTMQSMWANFAKTGDPSTAEYPWPAYEAAKRSTMILGPEVKVVNDPLKARRKLVEKMWATNPAFHYTDGLTNMVARAK